MTVMGAVYGTTQASKLLIYLLINTCKKAHIFFQIAEFQDCSLHTRTYKNILSVKQRTNGAFYFTAIISSTCSPYFKAGFNEKRSKSRDFKIGPLGAKIYTVCDFT